MERKELYRCRRPGLLVGRGGRRGEDAPKACLTWRVSSRSPSRSQCGPDREYRTGEPRHPRGRVGGRAAARNPHHGGVCRYLGRLRALCAPYRPCLRLRSPERRQPEGRRCAVRPHAQRAGPRRRDHYGARAPELHGRRQPGGAQSRGCRSARNFRRRSTSSFASKPRCSVSIWP